ncbi:MAG: hypothetical protein KC448_03345 [Yoonia sp.]|nr:hypothetical protein [Yoonia sp.]
MVRRGAGAANGGESSFLLGRVIMIGGGYLLLNSLSFWSWYAGLWAGVPVISGMILIVFMFGAGFVFCNREKWWIGV